jgi:hypothetical protein
MEPGCVAPRRCLSSEKLAVLTSSHLLRITEGTGAQVLTLARALGAACRLQIEMDRWIKASLETRKEKRAEDPNAKTWDALASFRTRYPNAGTREWRTWRKKVEGLETEEWTSTQETHLGAHLIHLAAEACPTWFTLEIERVGAKTTTTIRLSETALNGPPASRTLADRVNLAGRLRGREIALRAAATCRAAPVLVHAAPGRARPWQASASASGPGGLPN